MVSSKSSHLFHNQWFNRATTHLRSIKLNKFLDLSLLQVIHTLIPLPPPPLLMETNTNNKLSTDPPHTLYIPYQFPAVKEEPPEQMIASHGEGNFLIETISVNTDRNLSKMHLMLTSSEITQIARGTTTINNPRKRCRPPCSTNRKQKDFKNGKWKDVLIYEHEGGGNKKRKIKSIPSQVEDVSSAYITERVSTIPTLEVTQVKINSSEVIVVHNGGDGMRTTTKNVGDLGTENHLDLALLPPASIGIHTEMDLTMQLKDKLVMAMSCVDIPIFPILQEANRYLVLQPRK